MHDNCSILFFRWLVLTILFITMMQGFKASSTMNITELLYLNGHINMNPRFKPEGPTHMNSSALKPLFWKLCNIKLSHSVFRVTTFFQFPSTKTALQILLQYMHDFKENLIILYSKLVTINDLDNKSYDVRQHVLTYSALLKLCTHELKDCKSQITQLTTQVNHTFATLHQTSPKCSKRGIIHSLFNFLFGNPNSLTESNCIKNNMAILEENQDILSDQIQKTFNSVNLTYTETNTNRLLLRSLQKDILKVNNTVHCLSKELKELFTTEISLSLCFN